jgi:hypothetical protein
MKVKVLFLFIVINHVVHAQSRQLQFSFGSSKHGTGDIKGLSYKFDYTKYFKKKLSWQIGLGGDIHDGVTPLYFEYPAGNQIDGSYKYTTAGLQLGMDIRYSILKTDLHEIVLSAGGLVRYQTSSSSDVINILYSPITNLPYPVIVLENTTPQKTISVGATPKFGYNYTIKKKIAIGFLSGFQFDTNGDTILQFFLTLSRRF